MARLIRAEPAREPEGAIAGIPPARVSRGCPSAYRREFNAGVRTAAELGATPAEIAAALGVDRKSLFNWSRRNPEFGAALKAGRTGARKRPDRQAELAGALACCRAIAQEPWTPSHCRPEFMAIARNAAELGATSRDIAHVLGIHPRSLRRWAATHPEFAAALKVGKAAADDRVERALYERAVGYAHETLMLTTHGGKVTATPVVQHHPPDVRAAIFWLKNRRPAEWRETQEHEVSAPGGAPLPALQVTFVRPGER